MVKTLLVAGLLACTATAAHATLQALTDDQLGQTVAGVVIGGPVGPEPIVPPIQPIHPLPPHPPIWGPLPPVINPGGPCQGGCGH